MIKMDEYDFGSTEFVKKKFNCLLIIYIFVYYFRFMATGESLANLAFSYRLGHATKPTSVHMVCAAVEKLAIEWRARPTWSPLVEADSADVLDRGAVPQLH